jgi:hypothetical protein
MKNLWVLLLCFVTALFLSRCNSDNEPQESQFKPFILRNVDEDVLTTIPSDVIPGIHAELISTGRLIDAANFLKTYDKATGELLVPLQEVENSKPLSSGRTKSGERLYIRASIQNTGWVTYKIQNIMPVGWTTATVGTTGQNKYMEAFRILWEGSTTAGAKITYIAHVAGIGWQWYCSSDCVAGTIGEHRAIEAIRIAISSQSGVYSRYRAHVSGIGWLPWVTKDQIAGTTGQSRRLEAFQLEIYLYN